MNFQLSNPKIDLPDLMPFGKYKGQPISKLSQDPKYVTWLLSKEMIQLGVAIAQQPWLKNFTGE